MTERDKTQQKLIDSIRKSKDAAAATPAPDKPTRRRPSKAKPTTRSSAATTTSVSDPYQIGRRVWPD